MAKIIYSYNMKLGWEVQRCFLIQQKNIPNFMEEYKTHNFDDACDVILTKMLSSNDKYL